MPDCMINLLIFRCPISLDQYTFLQRDMETPAPSLDICPVVPTTPRMKPNNGYASICGLSRNTVPSLGDAYAS